MELYLISTAAAVALASFASLNKKVSDGLRGALGIVMLAALFSQIPTVLTEIEQIDPEWYIGDFGSDLTENAAENAFCRGIAAAVAEKFDLDEASVFVECMGFSFAEMRAELIRVELCGSAALADRIGIKNYIEKQQLGECEVVIFIE